MAGKHGNAKTTIWLILFQTACTIGIFAFVWFISKRIGHTDTVALILASVPVIILLVLHLNEPRNADKSEGESDDE